MRFVYLCAIWCTYMCTYIRTYNTFVLGYICCTYCMDLCKSGTVLLIQACVDAQLIHLCMNSGCCVANCSQWSSYLLLLMSGFPSFQQHKEYPLRTSAVAHLYHISNHFQTTLSCSVCVHSAIFWLWTYIRRAFYSCMYIPIVKRLPHNMLDA